MTKSVKSGQDKPSKSVKSSEPEQVSVSDVTAERISKAVIAAWNEQSADDKLALLDIFREFRESLIQKGLVSAASANDD